MSTTTFDAALVSAPARPQVNKWLVTVSVSFGTLMGAIDTSIVNVALNQIRGSVGATVQEITWISTGFVIATVMVMPLTAFFGRMFGQKRVYMACLALFVVGSFLCGVAWNLPSLVIFRAIQGLGAGALQPTEQAILRQTFPPKEQGMAMSLFAMAVMIGPAVGPSLGGYIVDNFHWSWIFFINLPVGVVGLLMVWRFVHEPEDVLLANRREAEKQKRHMDWAGIAFLCVGLATLQYALEEGQVHDWFESPLITLCFIVAGFCIAAFAIRELTAPVPAVNLRLFKDPAFASGTIINAVMFSVLMAGMFLLPLFMQTLLGFTATQSGFALMPRTLVMMAAMPFVGRFYNRLPARLVIAVGVLLTGIGNYQMSGFTLETGQANIISSIMLQGLGFSLIFVPLTTIALASVPRTLMADATGLNSLFRQVGGSIGLAVFATLLGRYPVEARSSMGAHLFASRPEVTSRLSALQAAFSSGPLGKINAKEAALRVLDMQVTRQATLMSFDKLFLISAALFVVVLPLLLLLKSPKEPSQPVHVEVEV